jgi:spermidine/putrescine transport system permease protein
LLASKFTIVNPEAITGISLALLFTSTWVALGMNLGFFTVILAHISFCTPYAIVTIYPRMAKMNTNLIYASYDLGYSKVQTF